MAVRLRSMQETIYSDTTSQLNKWGNLGRSDGYYQTSHFSSTGLSLAGCVPQRREVMLSDRTQQLLRVSNICCNLHEDVDVIIFIRMTSPGKFVQ